MLPSHGFLDRQAGQRHDSGLVNVCRLKCYRPQHTCVVPEAA